MRSTFTPSIFRWFSVWISLHFSLIILFLGDKFHWLVFFFLLLQIHTFIFLDWLALTWIIFLWLSTFPKCTNLEFAISTNFVTKWKQRNYFILHTISSNILNFEFSLPLEQISFLQTLNTWQWLYLFQQTMDSVFGKRFFFFKAWQRLCEIIQEF